MSCFPRGPQCQSPSVRVSGPGGPSGGCGRGASGPGGHLCLGLLCYWASSSPPTRPPLVTIVAQLSSCWRPGLGRRSLRGDGRRGEVTAAPAPLTVLLGCRFVSRVFVVPDHPHLLLSASGVSVPRVCPPVSVPRVYPPVSVPWVWPPHPTPRVRVPLPSGFLRTHPAEPQPRAVLWFRGQRAAVSRRPATRWRWLF